MCKIETDHHLHSKERVIVFPGRPAFIGAEGGERLATKNTHTHTAEPRDHPLPTSSPRTQSVIVRGRVRISVRGRVRVSVRASVRVSVLGLAFGAGPGLGSVIVCADDAQN